jgi:hypothetical protein
MPVTTDPEDDLTPGEPTILRDAKTDDVSFGWVLIDLDQRGNPPSGPEWRLGVHELDAAFQALERLHERGRDPFRVDSGGVEAPQRIANLKRGRLTSQTMREHASHAVGDLDDVMPTQDERRAAVEAIRAERQARIRAEQESGTPSLADLLRQSLAAAKASDTPEKAQARARAMARERAHIEELSRIVGDFIQQARAGTESSAAPFVPTTDVAPALMLSSRLRPSNIPPVWLVIFIYCLAIAAAANWHRLPDDIRETIGPMLTVAVGGAGYVQLAAKARHDRDNKK